MLERKKVSTLMLVTLVTAMFAVPAPAQAATVPLSLTTSGTSHIGWMFNSSSWDNKAGWNTTAGYSAGSGDHNGTDYYADDWNLGSGNNDCGQEVRAPFAGNVIFRGLGTNTDGSGNGYGYQVIIQADANTNFAYRATHLQKDSLTSASHVNQGDVIGRMGGSPDHTLINGIDYWSGNSTACHLHSVLYKNIYSNTTYGTTAISRLQSRGGVVGSTATTGPDSTFATPFYNDANPPSGGGTSACATYNSNGVTFFANAQCVTPAKQFTTVGFANLTDYSFNDAAKSMSVQSGWSVRIWNDTNRGGATACITGTKWDMSLDKYENGTPIVSNNQGTISSFELFNNSTCTVPQSACATYSAPGITLFSSTQCANTTPKLQLTTPGFYNIYVSPYNFNDAAKSLSVQSGWSARIYEHDNRNGATRCVSGTMWDLTIDKYDNGTAIATAASGTITSLELFSNGNCTPADTTKPTGNMTGPAKNSYQRGSSITLTANASDVGSGVAKVDFYGWSTAAWSGQQWKLLGSDTTAPYSLSWNLSGIQDGGVYATIEVTDNAGNKSGYIWDPNWTVFTIDRTAPTGMMTSPAKNTTFTGSSVPLAANASDVTAGVSKVEFYAWSPASWSNQQWKLIGTDTSAPYSMNWSIAGLASTYVYITVKVYDKAGNDSGFIWDPNWTVINIVH